MVWASDDSRALESSQLIACLGVYRQGITRDKPSCMLESHPTALFLIYKVGAFAGKVK